MPDEVDSIDRFVGNKIKERRKALKLSQSKLAEMMGLSYQQIQKYESGSNKVTVKRLIHLSKALNVPSSYFYEGIELQEQELGEAINSNVIRTERTKPLNILLIEDDAADEILLRNVIEDCEEDVNVHSIQNPDSVLEYLRNHKAKYAKPRPDIIILDLIMPKSSGVDILKQIKKDREIADIPVIIFTNSINVQEMVEVYKHHASGFIPKSVDFNEMSESITTAIKYWCRTVVLPNM